MAVHTPTGQVVRTPFIDALRGIASPDHVGSESSSGRVTVGPGRGLLSRNAEALFGSTQPPYDLFVDAPPQSTVAVGLVRSDARAIRAELTDATGAVLDTVTFAPSDTEGLQVVHRAVVDFSEPRSATAYVGGRKITETWVPVVEETVSSGGIIALVNPAELHDASREIFGEPLTAEQWRELLAIGAGARAQVSVASLGVTGQNRLDVVVTGGTYAVDRRGYLAEPHRTLFIDDVRLAGEQGQGTGLHAFIDMVCSHAAQGVEVIKCHAARQDWPGSERASVGYYVWPRYGFNAPLPDRVLEKLRRERPDLAEGTTDLLGLFAKPGGAQWWRKNGVGVNVEFSLDPNGPNVRALLRYLSERVSAKRLDPQVLARVVESLGCQAPTPD
jgi:hypothetical protein